MLDDIMARFTFKRFHLIMEEGDVISVLKNIQHHHKTIPDMAVGNCGWADDPSKWFVHFSTSEFKWNLIRKDLKVVRVYEEKEIPKDKKGVIYSTD